MSGEIESVQEEYRIIRKNDSQVRYLQTVTIAERDDQGVLIRLVGSAIDYTETREANFKIKANEEKYRRIIEHMSLGLVEMDKEGKVVFVNPKFKELTLLEDASALIIPYQNPTALRNKVKNGDIVSFANVEKDVVEVDFIREDDKKMTLLVSTAQVKNQEGNTTGFISIYLDITTVKQLQKNLENALSERNQSIMQVNTMKGFYESILDHSPSEISVFDRNLNVTFSNGKNLKGSNLWNDSLRLILDPHLEGALPEHLEKIRAAIKDKKLVQLEDRVKIEENEDLYTLRIVLPYYNDFGDFDNLIVTGIDITELKKIQIDIQDKNEELKKINLELDNFVYSISHDLRSPLLSIRGIISLILHDSKLDESTVSFLNLADNSITRLDNTIQEILDYSRNSRLDVAPSLVDVNELVSTVFDDLRYSSDDGLKTDINIVGSPLIYSDKSRLGVLLKNIIGNSIKYRKPGVDTHIRFDMQKVNDDIVIQISDNGEGIAPQNVDKVFNMFFRGTTNSVGTGLGLYICKEIVNKLGGSIRVESQLGIGTTMTVKLNQKNTTR
jgi:PAS domain S-box-containing protein